MNKILPRALSVLLLLACLLGVTACGQKAYRNDLAAPMVLDTVLAAVSSADGYTPVSDGYINESGWGEDYGDFLADLSNYKIVISEQSDMNIDELGLFCIRERDDVDDATETVRAYIAAQTMRYKDLLQSYNPDELPKLDNAKVTVCGQYILYTILDEDATKAAHDAFEKAVEAE